MATRKHFIEVVFERIVNNTEDVVVWTQAAAIVDALIAAGMLPPCNKQGNYDWDPEPTHD